MTSDNTMASNILEFLRTALAGGPVSVQDLQSRARAAGLLEPDQPISQSKSLRTIADKLGVRRFQAVRRWWWALPGKRNRAGKTMVSDSSATSAPEILQPDDQMTTEQFVTTAPEPNAAPSPATSPADALPPDAPASPEPVAVDYEGMSRKEFVRHSIENRRALAREADAEAGVRVARYLQTGDLADLIPEQNSSAKDFAAVAQNGLPDPPAP